MVGRDEDDQWAHDRGYVSVARLSGAHGVRGDARLIPFTEDADTVFTFDKLFMGRDLAPVTLKARGKTKDGYIVSVSGITSREMVDRVKTARFYVERAALDALELADGDLEDAFFLDDLIGLEVQALDGTAIGRLRAVENYGAEDLLELALDKPVKGFGKLILLPFRTAFVPTVSLEGGFVIVDLNAWLVDHMGGDSVEQGEAADIPAGQAGSEGDG